uniref:Small ribosomal subunit protein uS3m n=1 Tax=Amanita thiersii TaxID=235537 RepID=A0A5Q0N2H9_9AGAR|nr:ribosomal protein S3 [Amanita thiersii]QFZ98703.1 ribosomal protein S3 [Amanita thiersii]
MPHFNFLLHCHLLKIGNFNYFNEGEFFFKKFALNNLFNSINKSNKIKIEHSLNSIFKNKEFDYYKDSISKYSNPIKLNYFNNSLDNNNNNNNNNNNQNHNKNNILSQSKPIINQYLKAISKYNRIYSGISMNYTNVIGFFFNNNTKTNTKTNINKIDKNIYKLLEYSFKSMFCLISKPIFVIKPKKISIQFFYYLFIPNILKSKKIFKIRKIRRNNLRFYLNWKKRRKTFKKLYRNFRRIDINNRMVLKKLYLSNISKVYPLKFKFLCEILSNFFKKPIVLDLIRIHYPYSDSKILANLLAMFINRIKLRIIVKKLFGNAVIKSKKFSYSSSSSTSTSTSDKEKFNIIPAFLSGINIKVAGRLLNNKIVPRKTVKIIRRGAVAKGKVNYLDVARYTNKNKRGAYSITVTSGQKYKFF